MVERPVGSGLKVTPFEWSHWRALMELRMHQLAEIGTSVPIEEINRGPFNVGWDDDEWDYHLSYNEPGKDEIRMRLESY